MLMCAECQKLPWSKLRFLQASCPAVFTYLLLKGPKTCLWIGVNKVQAHESRSLHWFCAVCLLCPVRSNVMKILGKENRSKKGLSEPFLLRYSLLLSQLKFHGFLCIIFAFPYIFLLSGPLSVRLSQSVWPGLGCTCRVLTPPPTALAQIPSFHTGLVFGNLGLMIPVLATTACS